MSFMDSYTEFKQFGYLLVTFIILFQSSLPVSVDVLVIVSDDDRCVQSNTCDVIQQHQRLNWTFLFCPNDVFTILKTVRTLQADIVAVSTFFLLPTPATSSSDDQQQQHILPSCSQNYLENGDMRMHFVTQLSKTSIQDVIEMVQLQGVTSQITNESSTIISTIIASQHWKSFVMFTSQEGGVGSLSTVSKLSYIKGIMFTTNEYYNHNITMQEVYSSYREDDLNFIVTCPMNCALDLLKQAHFAEVAFSKLSRWFVVPSDGLKGINDRNITHIPHGDILLADTSSLNNRWKINNVEDEILSLWKTDKSTTGDFLIDVATKFINKTLASTETQLYSLRGKKTDRQLHHIGSVDSTGAIRTTEDLFPSFKYGFNGRTLTVGVLEWSMFLDKDIRENGTINYKGVCIDLLNELSHSMNFSYRLVEPADGEWGVDTDGKWNGLIGLVANRKSVGVSANTPTERSKVSIPWQRAKVGYNLLWNDSSFVMASTLQPGQLGSPYRDDVGTALGVTETRSIPHRGNGDTRILIYNFKPADEVDLIAAPLTHMYEREEVMDFTPSWFIFKSEIILKIPNQPHNKWLTLVAPFKIEVHICILFSLIFSTAVLFTMEEVNPMNPPGAPGCDARRIRFGDILWYHFGALMENGGAYLPITLSGRSILSFWWLFTVLSAAIYSGNLTAFFTDSKQTLPFTSLNEMVEQDTYQWGMFGGTSYETLFKNSNKTVYNKVWRGMQSSPSLLVRDMEEHKKRVMKGGYAYLGDEALSQLWKLDDCNIQSIVDPYLDSRVTVGLPNNSIYRRVFSEHILRINELGLPRLWYKRWYKSSTCETTRSPKKVDLLALQGAFYAAGVGIFIALMVLLIETIQRRRCRDHHSSNDGIVAQQSMKTRM